MRVFTVLLALKNPGGGFVLTVFALKNPGRGFVLALKNPGRGVFVALFSLKNPGRGFCAGLVLSQKPGSGVCVTSLAVLVQRSQSLTLVFQVS